jgi:iron complex outermembrane receptor protein
MMRRVNGPRLLRTASMPIALFATSARAQAQEPATEPVSVVVEGTPLHPRTPPRDESVAGSVVRREKLEAPGLAAADVLRRETGVEVVQYGGFGAPATASIRGATAAQTPVYLAGIRLNDEVGGSADLSQVPLWLIDRVEIYRGNAPLYADEFGIGGAILFEPPRPRRDAFGAGLTGGSFGTASGYAWGSTGDDRAGLLAGVELARAENDYPFANDQGTLFDPGDDRSGEQQNADASRVDGWAIGRARFGEASLEALANAATREQGVPKLSLVPSEEARVRYDRLLLGVRSRTALREPAGPITGFELASSYVTTRSIYDDPLRELGFTATEIRILGRRAQQRALLDLELSSALTLTTALDLSIDQLYREDVGVSRLGAEAVGGRLAGSLAWRLDDEWQVGLTGGLACRSADDGAACERAEPVGRVGVLRKSELWSAFANVGRYVRFPTLGELYGASALVRGNDALFPERGLTADVGARAQQRFGALQLWADVAAYARRADRLVSYVRAAQGYLVPVNIRSARVLGLETAAGADYASHVDADVSLTFTDPRDVTDERRLQNDILPFRSRFVASAGLGVKTGAHLPGTLDRSRARVIFLHQASRYGDPAGLIVIPAQSTFDLELSQAFFSERAMLRARAADLFDAARFDVVGYPLPGRSFFVSLEVRSR